MMDHRSVSRFSTGVPVRATRCRARELAQRPGRPGGAVLHLLRLVQHDPVPRAAGRAPRCRGRPDWYVVSTRSVPAVELPPGAVVDLDGQPRREPLDLPLPVAQHRQRAHDQRRWPGSRLAAQRFQRQQLHRLAQAHVVGQQCADAEPVEEGQPGQPPALVRPQARAERRRAARAAQLLGGPAGEQVGQPAGAIDLRHRQRLLLFRQQPDQPQRLTRGHLPGAAPGEEGQALGQLLGVQVHPPARAAGPAAAWPGPARPVRSRSATRSPSASPHR